MLIRCHCCTTEVGCLLTQDDFDRPNNLDINTGAPFAWSGDTSQFKILGNRLVSLGAGLITCPVPHPVGLPNLQATCQLEVALSADLVGFQLGSHRIEFKVGPLATGYVRFLRDGETRADASYSHLLPATGTRLITAVARDTRLVAGYAPSGSPFNGLPTLSGNPNYFYSPELPDGFTAAIWVGQAGIEISEFRLYATDGTCALTIPARCQYELKP
jgi:hypothetical protein